MKALSKYSNKVLIVQFLILVIPTLIIVGYGLFRLNNFYSILENNYLSQTFYFVIGLISSLILYRYNFRFISTFSLLLLINLIIYDIIERLNIGEFDVFYYSVKFYILSVLFCFGWLIGYAFTRNKTIVILWTTFLVFTEVITLSKTNNFEINSIVTSIIPAILYFVFILFSYELIKKYKSNPKQLYSKSIKQLSLFGILILIFLFFTSQLFKHDFKAIEKEWGGGKSKDNKSNNGQGESMTENGKDGGIKNKDQSKLAGNLNKDKQLVFVAKLNNYFVNTNIPNPLYFTANYYTKFDTATQTFEIDDKMPFNDLFSPNPSEIPLYFKKTDSSIIKKSLGILNREIISAEVYKVAMSPESFVAPSNAFYCQPITVPDEFKDKYKSAYLSKMWVSQLNSAYFIYNPAGNKMLENFQEDRFEILRTISNIKGPNKSFDDYYTYMPKNTEYNRIKILADSITKDFVAPIDKVIAIRNYFLSKDQFNQPLYKYTDNPGVPGLPSANKLNYFLFENRKGYCAYFAGATLFMLRSLNIPSRIAVGYLTEDRSSKNPGWYWFYQDQAHAWVQVYFQNYGWIDFDTTIPDVNTQQASQPDGTPPPEVPATYLVIDGEITKVDTLNKKLTVNTKKFLYHDTEFVSQNFIVTINDVSLADIHNDTGKVSLNKLVEGERATLVSHAEVLKNIFISDDKTAEKLLKKLKQPLPIDEVKLMKKIEEKDKKQNKNKELNNKFNWVNFFKVLLVCITIAIILIFCMPILIFLFFKTKIKFRGKSQIAAIQRTIHFYLHQLKSLPINEKSPSIIAQLIDNKFGTKMIVLNNLYQKCYYSKQPLTNEEENYLQQFYNSNFKLISSKFSIKQKILSFINIKQTINYFNITK
ncbi:MAG: transglutaminase-like domain-containing protein [Bacteroidia bacterium]